MATPELSLFYGEKLALLPASFYATSYAQQPAVFPAVQRNSSAPEERELAGLPPHGVVLCNFNHLHKTSRAMWAHWAAILRASNSAGPGGGVSGAETVLWTLNDSPETQGNIATELARHGARRDQVRFAGHELIWQHLHRHALADLFLDNLEYNGGTTGLDALWAGVPILSAPLEKFSARYGASFNRGVGLERLFTVRDGRDYEQIAIQLAARPALLAEIRRGLSAGKPRAALFDTPAFAQRFEALLRMQWEVFVRKQDGTGAENSGVGRAGQGSSAEDASTMSSGSPMHVVYNQAALDHGFAF